MITAIMKAENKIPVPSQSPCRGIFFPKKISIRNPTMGSSRIACAKWISVSGVKALFLQFIHFVNVNRIEPLVDVQYDSKSYRGFRSGQNDHENREHLPIK